VLQAPLSDCEAGLSRLATELMEKDVEIAVLENDLIAWKRDTEHNRGEYERGLEQARVELRELNEADLKREEEARRQMEEKEREWQDKENRLQEEIRQLKEQEKKKEEKYQLALEQARVDIKELTEKLNQVKRDWAKREEETRRQREKETREWQGEKAMLQKEITQLKLQFQCLKVEHRRRDYEEDPKHVTLSTGSRGPGDSSGFVSGNSSSVEGQWWEGKQKGRLSSATTTNNP
jgi:chromosome segregation ATPase